MKILKNYLYNMSYQILLLIVPLISMPYVSRVLGPNGLGEYSYTNSIMSYFILFGTLGFTLYGSKEIAYIQASKYKRSQVFWEVTFLKIITTLLAFISLIVFLYFFKQYKILIIAQSVLLISVAFDVSWYFMGIEDFKKTVIRNIIVKILSLILILMFVKTKYDLLTYILILGGSTLLGNVTLIPFLIKQISKPIIKEFQLKRHVVPVILLFLPQLATQIYLVVNKTMLGQMESISSVGFFSSSDTLVRITLTIVSALSGVLMPRIANLIARGEALKVKEYMEKSFEFINSLSLPMMFGLAAIAHKFVPLFLGEDFQIVSKLIIIESPVILLISWSIAITNQFLIPSNMNKEYITSTIIGAIFNVGANVFLIPVFGVYGAIIATLLSEILVVTYLLYSVSKYLDIKKMLFSNSQKYILASLVMFLIVIELDSLLSDTLLSIAIEVLISAVIYIGLLIIFRANLVMDIKHFFDE
ncbi:flippase [Leuconostoc citreum]|uniref:flippase n=2 Tax=Leuconostoc citreum TaxID=33964 RepID=UPI000A1F9B61|nr:flippase [Leuconostoc citreum]MDV8931297.1 flippase [Leuconostoc citreum]OSP82706.1 sugar isomerase [Leuconostoc citreum]TDM35915.1 flippase [Leuconostoc citreum]TPF02459.1 flippase [Leuconostoc citreum]